MEQVARIGRVLFVNDSKATNADAAAQGAGQLHGIYWIAGGRPKAGGLAGLEPLFPSVAKAYLIGEAADAFAAQLGDSVEHVNCGTLEQAVAAAAQMPAARMRVSPWCCCRRLAPLTTNSPISRCAAQPSAMPFWPWTARGRCSPEKGRAA